MDEQENKISEELLKQQNSVFTKRYQPITIQQTEEIIKTICDYFNIKYEEIFQNTRKKIISIPRMWCTYFLNKEIEMKSTDVAKFFNLDHSSVIKNKFTIKSQIDTYKDSLMIYHQLDTKVKLILTKR